MGIGSLYKGGNLNEPTSMLDMMAKMYPSKEVFREIYDTAGIKATLEINGYSHEDVYRAEYLRNDKYSCVVLCFDAAGKSTTYSFARKLFPHIDRFREIMDQVERERLH